jgi:YgiT-type zinc finger domain-containing protein
MIDTLVTYTIEHRGKLYVIEHVPARVCRETGEQYFAPETVEHLQAIVKGGGQPARVMETPVFEYA